ncbi:MAG: phenylalanine--tRNA ligase subunit beta [Calditrichia bacterium]
MKLSYNWLKDYVDINIAANELAERLSLTGLEVEELIKLNLDFPHVVVGHVLEVEKHPNADKLSLCRVDAGEENLSIVCGAPNVVSGQKVAVAKIGAVLPGGLKIKKSKIRGVASQGMICSEAELGLAEDSPGIWVLPETLETGKPLNEALDFKTDYILDVAVTPNRPDCLSHIGVAREIAAMLRQPLRKPIPELKESKETAASQVKIRIESPESCPRYSARIIRGIRVGNSPAWLVRRLEAVGMRSVNNVVDITNFVMMETGQPLHAFDFDRIAGSEIIVRESREGEMFTTLDEKKRTLRPQTVLICNAKEPVAIGGIMGGLNSEVSSQTRNILLESAWFQPESIQRSARYLNLSTEASQRFARGADPDNVIYAQDRAAALLAEICGGEILQGSVDEYPNPVQPKIVEIDFQKINKLLGTEIPDVKMKELLTGIELEIKGNRVTVPTFRPDITQNADLAEEVARLYGLDRIPAADFTIIPYDKKFNELDLFQDRLKEWLVGMGLQEVITNSMINKKEWEELTGNPVYPVMNPLSQDMDGLRNSLIPSLLQVIQYNLNRKRTDLAIFEINPVFLSPTAKKEPPREETRLTIALTGRRDADEWYSSSQVINYYDIKGLVESLLFKNSLDNSAFFPYPEFSLSDLSQDVQVQNISLGVFGKISSKILQHFGIEQDVYFADLSVAQLFKQRKTDQRYQSIPRFPAVERDLALVVGEEVEAGSMRNLFYEQGGDLLTEVRLFDVFRGKQVESGKKSLAFRLFFQATNRTLTEDEVSRIMENILKTAASQYNAKLRD